MNCPFSKSPCKHSGNEMVCRNCPYYNDEAARLFTERGQISTITPKVSKGTRHAIPTIDGMNKLESLYAREELEVRKMARIIDEYRFEAVKLRLAHNTFYIPDFMITIDNLIEFHEIKGHWEDDARVKIKVAAEMYPEFTFIAVQRKKGIWVYEYFHSRKIGYEQVGKRRISQEDI
jgi:hypothetical protein